MLIGAAGVLPSARVVDVEQVWEEEEAPFGFRILGRASLLSLAEAHTSSSSNSSAMKTRMRESGGMGPAAPELPTANKPLSGKMGEEEGTGLGCRTGDLAAVSTKGKGFEQELQRTNS
ncbi:hypothetical protein HPP92_013710 [Vanilla planifolia]|uniref:Uncharacterized protein n=1 Tax=Vanilla planifolia TaxID=51239 RepID=A0A835V0V9_VANPL|nr:hypothetical protein HPP92_013710 [Vanilla planifolia]